MLKKLGVELLLLDGGMGSEIERLGLPSNNTEELNMTNPEEIASIHESYSNSDIITTNTFGLNPIKYKGSYNIEDIAKRAISLARRTGKKVFFDMGPTGKMLKPIGLLTFDEAYDAYKYMVDITKDLVDGYILETFSDIYELKAAVLAVKENTDKCLFSTMTFSENGRTLTGTTPEIAALILDGLGVDALGVNCSLGPSELYNIVVKMASMTEKPIVVQPNRGLPKIKDGKAYYDLSCDEFVKASSRFLDLGVAVLGGCCGTTPEFIKALEGFHYTRVIKRNVEKKTIVTSGTELVDIDGVKVCGERLNPTGKKKLKEALLNEDYNYLVKEALKQEEAGASLLDLNVGLPKIDEVNVMKNAMLKVCEFTSLPIQIDSSNKEAIEVACRYYNGIPLINSVNGTKEVMDKVFPIAKKYGAVVLGLAMSEAGIPKTANERFEIAKSIVEYAKEYDIPKHKIMIDTLVLTASAEQKLVKETLDALTLVRDNLGVKTALGVSNVSFGLPQRGILNHNFLSMAIYAGLNMPILNPGDIDMMNTIYATDVLLGRDVNSIKYVEKYSNVEALPQEKPKSTMTLYDAIIKGLKDDVKDLTLKELETKDPLDVINNVVIKALLDIGDKFDKQIVFLPQLIASAEASKEAFAVISTKFDKLSSAKSTIIFATVEGDVHDIGKNICKVVLESYGYNVIDLGSDAKISYVVESYKKYNPSIVCLSALMTTTVIKMEETIKALKDAGCDKPIFVGGAVLSSDIASKIGANYYTKDAISLVNKIESLGI